MVKDFPPKYMSNSYCEVLKLQDGQGFKKIFLSRENTNVYWINERQEILVSIKRKWSSVTLFVGALNGAALIIKLLYDGEIPFLSLYPKELKPVTSSLVFSSVLLIFIKWEVV